MTVSTDESTPQTDQTEARPLSVQWHPDALRPPFEWNVQLPPDWAVIETHPTRWKRQNERIVDDFFDGRRVPSKVRNALLRSLGDAVATAQQKKVLLTLVKPAIDEDGRVSNIAMNLIFSSSSPRLASMAPVKRAFGSKETYVERTTPSGSAYGTVTVRKKQRDGAETREVLSVQGFLPMAGTTWTLAVGVTTPQVDLEKQLVDMVIRCVSSVRTPSDHTAAATQESASPSLEPLDFDEAIALVDHVIGT